MLRFNPSTVEAKNIKPTMSTMTQPLLAICYHKLLTFLVHALSLYDNWVRLEPK